METCICTGLYFCGHIPNVGDDGTENIVVIALEFAARTFFVRDSLPVAQGSTLHRLAEAASGFSAYAGNVKIDELLGQPVFAEVVSTETFAALRAVKSFPRPPRCTPADIVHTSIDPRLTGQPAGERHVIGALLTKPVALPEPPKPRGKLREWRITELTRPVLPEGLPPIVCELAQRSVEWQRMVETSPTKRK